MSEDALPARTAGKHGVCGGQEERQWQRGSTIGGHEIYLQLAGPCAGAPREARPLVRRSLNCGWVDLKFNSGLGRVTILRE
jgi:hypothetical protein